MTPRSSSLLTKVSNGLENRPNNTRNRCVGFCHSKRPKVTKQYGTISRCTMQLSNINQPCFLTRYCHRSFCSHVNASVSRRICSLKKIRRKKLIHYTNHGFSCKWNLSCALAERKLSYFKLRRLSFLHSKINKGSVGRAVVFCWRKFRTVVEIQTDK